MWIESTPGSGSTVFFRLPAGPPAPVPSNPRRWLMPDWEYRRRTRPSLAPLPVARPRLAVIETGDTLQRMLARYLDGADVVPFASLAEAQAGLTNAAVETIILNDRSVPDALQRLTRETLLPAGVPTILCSVPETPAIAQAMGATDYLVKPIAQDRLLAALDGLSLKGRTILIVDDEPDASRLFIRMLAASRRRYRFLRASNGEEALGMLRRKRKPSAVLLDLVMPGMDGFRVLSECARDPLLQRIPVIVTSARDPTGYPVISSAIAVTQGGGLTTQQILAIISSVRDLLAPKPRPADREPPEAPAGQPASASMPPHPV
jgi:CheY-like chemotaxis protein